MGLLIYESGVRLRLRIFQKSYAKFSINKGAYMKTIKYEVKLEKSVKVILGTLVFGIILNAFLTPIGQELLGIKNANAGGPIHKIAICDETGSKCAGIGGQGNLRIYNFGK